MIADQFRRFIFVAVIENRSVVARENEQGPIVDDELLKYLQQRTDNPVRLHNGIAARAHRAFSFESRVGESRNMDVVE